MKRDIDLVRKILLLVEASDCGQVDLTPLLDEINQENQIQYHAALIYSHALAEGIVVKGAELSGTNPDYTILTKLTWAGHDFVESARDERIWNKAKSHVLATAGALTLEAMAVGLKVVVEQAIRGVS